MSDLVFAEEIYEKHLRVINNVKFTYREIDIISCILSGKTPHAIANFLSTTKKTLELQTVNTHIQNIRKKIGGSARGSIIDFIEKSDKYKIVQQYYLCLLVQKGFYESLNEVASFLKDRIESFSITRYQQVIDSLQKQDYNSKILLINYLQNSLKLLTDNVRVDKQQHYSSLPPLPSSLSAKHYKIYILEPSLVTTEQMEGKEHEIVLERLDFKKHITNTLLLSLGPIDNRNIIYKSFDYIDVSMYENQYFLFFEILKKFFHNHRNRIEEILVKFNERYNTIVSSGSPDSSNYLKATKTYNNSKNSILIKLKSLPHLYIYAILAVLILCLCLIKKSSYTQNIEQKYNKTTNVTIESAWNTPYLPVYFVNRTRLRDEILSKLQHNEQKLNQAILVGLHGLGGVGKTYLALDAVNNPVKHYSFRGWITANDEDKLKANYFKLGNELGLLRDDMKEEQKISVVRNWFNSQESLLLVFDNVPNIEIIEKYLPQKGDIIITSRNYKIPSAIEVDVMEESESLELLKNLISNSQCHDKCTTLVKKLGYLPLAISQAGAYIAQNQITIDKYLELYKEEKNILLSSEVMPVSDRHIPVYIAWNLSLKEIRDNDKTGKAINLLNILAFCHFVDIPKSFLIEYLYGVTDNKTEIEFNKIVSFLRQYSLLKVTPDTVAIHHLLQDCIRSTMNLQEQKIVLKKAIDTIKKIYPLENKKSNDYELVKILLPQIEDLYFYTKKHLGLLDSVQLIIYIADAYRKLGDYNKAKTLLEEALTIQENYYGTHNHVEIITTLNVLGHVYLWFGDYKKAKELLEEALNFHQKHHSTHNRKEIALILHRLGHTYLWLGDYNKAKTFLEEALTIQENYYGTRKHIETSSTIRRLARVYLSLGDYNKAKVLSNEALTFYENYYGTRKHIEITFILNTLGRTYLWSGDHSKAQILFEEALSIQEHYYGTRKHTEIAFTLSRLGQTYLLLGDYNKAKTLLKEALAIQENYYGTHNHVAIIYTMDVLGETYLRLGEYCMARELLEKAMAFQESYYGPNHPEVANALISLAQLENITHNDNYALSLVERASNILQNYPGLNLEHNYIKKAKKIKQQILNKKDNL